LTWGLLTVFAMSKPHIERLPDAPPPVPPVPADASETLRRGAELYRTSACVGCHTPPFDDGEHLGGGRDLPTVFGVFYAPNISPDPEAGIGTWEEEDFVRAMREGRAPDGRRYWPTFPYMAYTKMSDEDIHALWVYIADQEPVAVQSKPHEVKARYSLPGLMRVWRAMGFRAGPLEEDPNQDAQWNRGRYLVEAVSYCDQCHSPRNRLGLIQQRRYMAGGANPGKADVHPNLTPAEGVGLADWSAQDIATYLAGNPDKSTLPKNIMAEKIHDSFSYYEDEDRLAIGVYLNSLPPNDFDPAEWSMVKRERRKAERAAK
jgi:mono/diheme cytochrome c family protein